MLLPPYFIAPAQNLANITLIIKLLFCDFVTGTPVISRDINNNNYINIRESLECILHYHISFLLQPRY